MAFIGGTLFLKGPNLLWEPRPKNSSHLVLGYLPCYLTGDFGSNPVLGRLSCVHGKLAQLVNLTEGCRLTARHLTNPPEAPPYDLQSFGVPRCLTWVCLKREQRTSNSNYSLSFWFPLKQESKRAPKEQKQHTHKLAFFGRI